MDSRDKRSSAIGVSLPWRGMLPVADSAVSQADRQHAALMYRGVLATSEPESTTPVFRYRDQSAATYRSKEMATSTFRRR